MCRDLRTEACMQTLWSVDDWQRMSSRIDWWQRSTLCWRLSRCFITVWLARSLSQHCICHNPKRYICITPKSRNWYRCPQRCHLLAHPLRVERRRAGLMPRWCFIFIYIFSDFCQTDYLNIYRTDLYEICRDLKLFIRPLKGRCCGNRFGGQNRPPFHAV